MLAGTAAAVGGGSGPWLGTALASQRIPVTAVVIPSVGLNVRNAPGLAGSTVKYVAPGGSQLDLTGVTEEIALATWYQVDDGNWVHGGYLNIANDTSEPRVVTETRTDANRESSLPTPAANVDPIFQTFYTSMGGASTIGTPLTPTIQVDGRNIQVFSNFALEHWPEHSGTPYHIQPALLGVWASGNRYFGQVPPFHGSQTVSYVPETRQSLRFGFLSFWNANGGKDLFGHPISEEVIDGGITAQWFQRGKLTYDPARRQPIQVEDIGRQWLENRNGTLGASYTINTPTVTEPSASTPIRVELTNSGTETWTATGPNRVSLGFRWADRHPPRHRKLPGPTALPHDVASGEQVAVELSVPMPGSPGPFLLQPDLRIADSWFTHRSIPAPNIPLTAQLEEPEMRVGILDISDDNPGVRTASITSTEGLHVIDETGSEMAELGPDLTVVVQRDIPAGHQTVDFPNGSRETTGGLVTVRPANGSFLQVAETAPWHTYRGSLEFAWLPQFQAAWLVNILPIGDYLSGIAEQADYIPWESLRASAIAFRSYAVATRGERRAQNRLFDAASSTHHTPTMFTRHQVYHGMSRELSGGSESGTRLRQAVAETRGQVMTHSGQIIMAVYFSQADGHTRTWHEEWGGPAKPWATGVPDPFSKGLRLLGHGIGLPLRSANAMGATGANGEQILARYYRDVDFNFIY